MNFKEFYNLNEMLVIGQPTNDKYVIAFDKWIWVLDDNTPDKEKILTDIENKLQIPEVDYEKRGYKRFKSIRKGIDSDIYEFITNVQEQKNDVLIGQIQNKTLYLYDYGSFKLDPKSSVLVNKVVKQLKLNSAEYTEDIDSTTTKVTKKKMTMQIPEVVYHGTSSKYLDKIMSIGLRAGETDSNYAKQGIYHDDLVFFSSRIGEAMHHATHTASLKGGIPIILEFQIPDKHLVISDYDVEKLTDNPRHYKNTGPEKAMYGGAYKQDPDKLSKEFGIYGYKGNIKPIFIKNIYVAIKPIEDVYNIKTDFKKMKPKSASKYIEYYA